MRADGIPVLIPGAPAPHLLGIAGRKDVADETAERRIGQEPPTLAIQQADTERKLFEKCRHEAGTLDVVRRGKPVGSVVRLIGHQAFLVRGGVSCPLGR